MEEEEPKLCFEMNLTGLVMKMYQTRKETGDFVIKCDRRQIPCHKMILASSSPVFRAMIRNKMKESEHGEMDLDTFSFDTVGTMIKFFYTKDIKKDSKIDDILGGVDYNDLLRAADFFQVPILKKICEYSLANGMTKDTALECYKIAKLYNAEILVKDAKHMIIQCKAEIMAGHDWKEKLKELNDPDLMIEMIAVGNDWKNTQEQQQKQQLQRQQQQHQQQLQTQIQRLQQQLQQQQPLHQIYPSQRHQQLGLQPQQQLQTKLQTLQQQLQQHQQQQNHQTFSYMTVISENTTTNNWNKDGHEKNTNLCQQVLDDMRLNFASLYNDQDTADLTCSMKRQEWENISIHNVFLKLYSEALLNKISKGNKINELERDVLKFLYTGKIADYDKKAEKLIELAHNFKLPLLRSYCEDTLIATLSVENVLERFIFASKNESTELRMKAKAMMMKENKNIIKTENWRSLIKNHVDIVFELLMEGFADQHK